MLINASSFRPQEFLSEMNILPYVLFLGSKFEIDESDNKKILAMPWNCIITSLTDENTLNKALNNVKRKTRNVYAKEVIRLKDSNNFRDKHNLKVVRLFNPSEEESQNLFAQKEAEKCLGHVIQSVGAQAVRLVILGYKKNDIFHLDSMLRCFADSDALRGVKTFIFDTDAQNDFFKLLEADKDNCDLVEIYSESLPHLLDAFLDDEQFDESEFPEINEDDYIFYASGKAKSLGKREHLNKYRFVHLLHEQEMENNVPIFMIPSYFYAFLKESPYEPQWYGYHEKNKFCLKRDIDDSLYDNCLKNLEKPGNPKQKLIAVVGNSGSGKSIAVANLAYRIFSEHRYPVIFQNRLDTFLNDDDSRLERLDNLLTFLEDNGAPAVLLIVDQSIAGKAELDKVLHIFRKLRNRGRNLTVVFTAYNEIDSYLSDDSEKDSLSFYSGFIQVPMNNELSNEELKRLRTLLKRKAKMHPDEIERLLVESDKNKNDFLVFLYCAFLDLRKPLAEKVHEQFIRTIQLVLDRKDLQDDIKDLLLSVAIASQFNIGIPCNLAYRLVRSLDANTIQTIARIPSFSYSSTEDGNYKFRMRTRLEANMLLRHFEMTPRTKINYIEKMLNNLRAEKDEITFMIGILRCIGANAPKEYVNDAKPYRDYDDIIIRGLENFRKETSGDPRMTLQEITYIREHAKYLQKNATDDKIISNEEYTAELLKAIAIGGETIKPLRISLARNRTAANLLVEMANSRVYLYEVNPTMYGKEFLDQAQEDLREVIATNPDRDNSAYAYTVLLRSMKAEIENPNVNELRKFELLAEAYDFIKRVQYEYNEVYENDYFYDNAQKIVEYFADQKLSDDMFDDMIKRHKSIGIYWHACKQLKEAGIEPYKHNKTKITDEQVAICRKVYDELLDNPKYKGNNTDLESNPECQRLLLHVVWLMYDKYPLFCEEKHRTGITLEGWQKLKEICTRNYEVYEYGGRLSKDYYNCHRFLYVLALCYAQLNEPENCRKIITIIRRETDDWEYGDNRIVTRHIICDENRIPKSDFAGEVVEAQTGRRGYIKIKDWSGLAGKKGIYFHERNLNGLSIKKGDYQPDFQLGLGYMGLSVFHGLKRGD